MALTNHAGFSPRGGASLPTDLGRALSDQLHRFFGRSTSTAVADATSLSGPTLEQLSPALMNEIARG